MILVVDDSSFARAALTHALRQRGLDAIVVASVAEVDVGRAYDAAVLDVEIGTESGVELAHRLRRSWPRLPIAFLTATPETAHRAHAEMLGPVFTKDDSLAIVAEWALGVRTPT